MSEDWKVQLSFKLGTGNNGMLNIRGNSVEEVDADLSTAEELLLPAIAGFEESAKAINVLQAGGLQPGPVAQPAQRTAQPGNGGGPTCVHGPRVFRSGADWKGWFCPADRSDPTKCKPQYDR